MALLKKIPMIQKQELHELEILKHVEETPHLSNRIAAEKLGCSIKLAHEVLKKMAGRGLLHIKKVHSRRWDYFLTPKGIAEKTRLSMNFLSFSMYFYHEARKLSSQLCLDLAESGVEKVSFLGAGDLAEIVYLGLKEWGLELEAIYDDDKKSFLGHETQSLSDLDNNKHRAVLVCMYDPKQPTANNYLPEGVELDKSFHWIFN
jgi:predicted transcriptional regulator